MMMINIKSFALLLCLCVGSIVGQEEQAVCDCGEANQRHEQCVTEWRALDELRKALEQQVRDVEFQSNQRCEAQVQQVRGEVDTLVAEARGESDRRAELVRSESQRQLEQVQSEAQAQLEQARNEAQQCQTHQQELNAQFEEQGSTHRRLQESSRQLEETLSSVQSEKAKLEKSVSDVKEALAKATKEKKAILSELDTTKKTLEEMVSARTVISIDWELLNEHLEEIRSKIEAATKDFMVVVAEHLKFARTKLVEFYHYLQHKVYPEVKRTVNDDVIPLVRSTSKQAGDLFEETYAPYRPEVNRQMKMVRQESEKFYKQNLEPHVKEYELDKHATTAKKTAQEYMTLAHNKLVEGVKSSTGIALNFVKLEEGPTFAIETLEKLHANYEDVAYYIECFFAAVVAYFVLKMLFGGKKKKGKKRMTKQQYKEKVEKEMAMAKKQTNNKKQNGKNGLKNGKKNK